MTPLLATLKGLAVAIVFAIVLGQIVGVAGIAMAIAAGAWSTAVALVHRVATTFGFSLDANARKRLPRIVLAALVMGALLWLKTHYVWPLVSDAHTLTQALVLGILMAGGLAIYGGLLVLTGVLDLKAIGSRLRR